MTYEEWLSFPDAKRVILVEASGYNLTTTNTDTFYFSTRNFVTEPTDTPSNTVYLPILEGNPFIDRSINSIESNQARLSIGDLYISNADNAQDELLYNYAWNGRALIIYLGNADWDRSSFETFFEGTLYSVGAKSDSSIQFIFRDDMNDLDTDLLTATMPASGEDDEDKPAPVVYGEIKYLTPAINDAANLKLQVHDGNESINDVAVNLYYEGVIDNTKISSESPSTGIITCTGVTESELSNIALETRGVDYGSNTLKNAIEWLVVDRGGESAGNLDSTSLTALPTYNVSFYYDSKINIIRAIDNLMPGYWMHGYNRDNKYFAKLIVDPSGETSLYDVYDYEMLKGSFKFQLMKTPNHKVTIGFDKSYYTGSVDGTIDNSLAKHSRNEYRESVSEDSAVKTLYPDSGELGVLNCAIDNRTDANLEAVRILNIVKKQRYIVSFKTTAIGHKLNRGDVITIYFPNYGLSSGKKIYVTGIKEWYNRNITQVTGWY